MLRNNLGLTFLGIPSIDLNFEADVVSVHFNHDYLSFSKALYL